MIQSHTPLLEDRCSHCHRAIESCGTINCTGCEVASYCSHDHQAADEPNHNPLCTSVQEARIEVEQQLRQLQSKCQLCFSVPSTDIEPDHSHFWEWRDIRCYIQAKRHLINTLCEILTEPALRNALHHALDILRLNPCDNMDTKLIIPDIMIRLGMDSEAQEFIRRSRTVSPTCQYAWAHLDLVLPEPRAEKEEEGPVLIEWLDECVPLPFKVALVLLKLRLLFCLQDLEYAMMLLPIFPPEIVRLVQDNLVGPGIMSNSELWKALRAGSGFREDIERIEKELHSVFEVVRTDQPEFWSSLCNPGGSRERSNRIDPLQSRQTWKDTPGALVWVQQKLELDRV